MGNMYPAISWWGVMSSMGNMAQSVVGQAFSKWERRAEDADMQAGLDAALRPYNNMVNDVAGPGDGITFQRRECILSWGKTRKPLSRQPVPVLLVTVTILMWGFSIPTRWFLQRTAWSQ